MSDLFETHYEWYLEILKSLVQRPTIFTHPDAIQAAIQFCKTRLQGERKTTQCDQDEAGNLIAYPCDIDTSRPCLYLSAHIDTVGFSESDWEPPFHPLNVFESPAELVGRGVSDCKAGVAFQLYLAHLQSIGALTLNNTISTITFNEEGGGKKTGTALGKAMGKALPLGPTQNLLLVLENTVSMPQSPDDAPILWAYPREKGNFVIKTEGPLKTIQNFLKSNPTWNPTCITPSTSVSWDNYLETQQPKRHVCSVPRDQNKLYQTLMSARSTSLLKSGSEKNFSILPSPIQVGQSYEPTDHTVVLSNRSFDSRKQVEAQICGVKYSALKPFDISEGMDCTRALEQSGLSSRIQSLSTGSLSVFLDDNIGCSDASIIFNALLPEYKHKTIPLVMGPGTRSQPMATPPRYTHGPNETFDNKAGLSAIKAITSLLEKLGFLRLASN